MPPTRSTRRSARERTSKDVIAPGFGTASDINRLTRDLGGGLPRNAVLSMMCAEGRGINSSSTNSTVPFTSPKTSSAWADFIQEEGVSNALSTNDAIASTAAKSNEPPSKKLKMEEGLDATSSTSIGETEYDLSALSTQKKEEPLPYGSLVQSGTLDSTLVGRKSLKSTDQAVYHLAVPTVLLPSVKITKVCTSCNAGT